MSAKNKENRNRKNTLTAISCIFIQLKENYCENLIQKEELQIKTKEK